MKALLRLSMILILTGALWPASAQVTVTRVLEGDIAEDTGYFRGCAWGDCDQDGNVDLSVCSSAPSGSGSVTDHLYGNEPRALD